MKKTPQVSIGMPVYNGERFIREAIDSLLAQTFTDFELIISDNASTDQTEAICQEYAKKDSRIRYVRQANNIGATANFEFVLDEAGSEFFMWAAADDRRHSDFLSITERVLKENLSISLVFSSMSTKNLLTGKSTYSTTGFITSKKKFQRVLFRLVNPCPSLIYGLYRTEVIKKLKIKSFDYFDCYIALWIELNSGICIVPINLYTAGTNGLRIPYSLTGELINEKTYIQETSNLFKENFGFFGAFFLSSINRYLIKKTTKANNRMIKLQRK